MRLTVNADDSSNPAGNERGRSDGRKHHDGREQRQRRRTPEVSERRLGGSDRHIRDHVLLSGRFTQELPMPVEQLLLNKHVCACTQKLLLSYC